MPSGADAERLPCRSSRLRHQDWELQVVENVACSASKDELLHPAVPIRAHDKQACAFPLGVVLKGEPSAHRANAARS